MRSQSIVCTPVKKVQNFLEAITLDQLPRAEPLVSGKNAQVHQAVGQRLAAVRQVSLQGVIGDVHKLRPQEGGALQDRVLVLYDAEIHESIAGIVAGRIKDKYYRPTILITDSEDGAKGSGRSIEDYHLFEALFANRDLFTRFGGHAMAAGLSLPVENIPVLRRRLNEGCTLTEEQMIPILRLEDALSFAEIDLGLAKELQTLAPFGKGNPAPLFASKGIHADRVDLIGKNKDILRLTLSEPENGIRLSAISFDGYEPLREMLKALYPAEDCDKIINSGLLPQLLDIVYSIEINSYRGRSNVQLILKDFRFAK